MIIMVKCKGWIESMMVILGARLKQPISRMISTLLFTGQGAWII
jgi:hypothetical protein